MNIPGSLRNLLVEGWSREQRQIESREPRCCGVLWPMRCIPASQVSAQLKIKCSDAFTTQSEQTS